MYIMQNYGFGSGFTLLLIPVVIWVIFWKCYAVWIAVKAGHKKWFVALLILNTFSILELIYVFGVANKKWSDVKMTIHRILK